MCLSEGFSILSAARFDKTTRRQGTAPTATFESSKRQESDAGDHRSRVKQK